MAVFDVNSNLLQSAYDIDGNELTKVYNVAGEELFFNEPFPLRIMTYNVGQWYYGSGDNVPANKDSAYYALQNGMIQANDPDILVLQEYWKQFSKLPRTAKSMLEQYFPYIYEQGGNSGYYGRCVCSKYPISNYTIRIYTGEQERYFDSCTVTVHGVPITIVNTHLGLTQTERDAEIEQLIAYLATQTRFLCCGDFNTVLVDGSASTSAQEYIDNVKPFIDAGFGTANFGEFGFLVTQVKNGGERRLCLDNCYTSSNITVEDTYVDTTKLTDGLSEEVDHMPLIADLLIT